MKRSQLLRRQARSATATTGRMNESDLCAATNAPGANFAAGPRGPSGVIATSCPACSSLTIEIRARSAPRVLDPRISPKPSELAARATSSPSRCSLIKTTTLWSRWYQRSGSRCPCQSAKMKLCLADRSCRSASEFRTRNRHVRASRFRAALPSSRANRECHEKTSVWLFILAGPRACWSFARHDRPRRASQAWPLLPRDRQALLRAEDYSRAEVARVRPPLSAARSRPV